MRVTADMMVAQSVRRLSQRMESYERVQQQVATGKKFAKPSQQPGDANTAMALRAARRGREQEQRAAADAESWLNVADTQMQSAVERLHRARDLAISANPAFTQTEREGIATELRSIRDELATIANAEHRGRPIFGGVSDNAPVSFDTGTGTWSVGGDGAVMRKVGPQETIRVNVTAKEAFTFAGGGDDVFTMLDDLIGHVQAGNDAAVSSSLNRMDAALENLGGQQTRVGAVAGRLESALGRNLEIELAIRTELSKTEDIDVAEAVMELQVQQLGFEATLKAVGMALPPSLVSFL